MQPFTQYPSSKYSSSSFSRNDIAGPQGGPSNSRALEEVRSNGSFQDDRTTNSTTSRPSNGGEDDIDLYSGFPGRIFTDDIDLRSFLETSKDNQYFQNFLNNNDNHLSDAQFSELSLLGKSMALNSGPGNLEEDAHGGVGNSSPKSTEENSGNISFKDMKQPSGTSSSSTYASGLLGLETFSLRDKPPPPGFNALGSGTFTEGRSVSASLKYGDKYLGVAGPGTAVPPASDANRYRYPNMAPQPPVKDTADMERELNRKLQQIFKMRERLKAEHSAVIANGMTCHEKIDCDVDLIISFLNDVRKSAHLDVDKLTSLNSKTLESQILKIVSAINGLQHRSGNVENKLEILDGILATSGGDSAGSYSTLGQKTTKGANGAGGSEATVVLDNINSWAILQKIKKHVFTAHLSNPEEVVVAATSALIPKSGHSSTATSVDTMFEACTMDPSIPLIRQPGIIVNGKGHEPGRFLNPSGIAVFAPIDETEEALLYVSDSNNHRIQVLSATTGEYYRSIGFGRGSGSGQLQNPMGIAVHVPRDPNDVILVYVADFNNHRVLIFNAITGAILQSIGGGKGTRPGQMQHPYGIAIHYPEGNNSSPLLFVAEYDNHRVQVFDAISGVYMRYYGGRGSGLHNLQCPTSVSLFMRPDKQLLLFVVDSANHRIQVYNDSTNRYLGTFGEGRGSGPGQLKNPIGSTIFEATNGNVFLIISEYDNHRIQIFNAITGSFVAIIGSGQGAGIGQLRGPWDIKLGPCTFSRVDYPNQRFLYVSEFGTNHRLQSFCVDFNNYSV